MAIISVDGHVRGSRAQYRTYFEQKYLSVYDEWVTDQEREGIPDTGGLKPGIDPASQWDSTQRWRDVEAELVVAEVLFPNGLPFSTRRFEDVNRVADLDLDRQIRLVYNRWLADFCAAFFDPALDPVWAACQDAGLPISQHGGAGCPTYQPPGFASIMTLAVEQEFYCGRSLWQMIFGGVFDRYPDLHVAYVETGAGWIGPTLRRLDKSVKASDDWMAFAKLMNREREFTRLPSEYWATNCHMGLSPFTVEQLDDGVELGDDPEVGVTPDRVMFGVDHPHFESITFSTRATVAELVAHPEVSEDQARGILYGHAAEVYGFDLTVLQPHIDRVGVDAIELQAS